MKVPWNQDYQATRVVTLLHRLEPKLFQAEKSHCGLAFLEFRVLQEVQLR